MKHTHNFVEEYNGLGAFGMDRVSDEETIIFYLQKFSDDELMKLLVKKMSNDELEDIYSLINRILKAHLTEAEYHKLFLKEDRY
ncbi:MAG: cytoplasmic protein [Deltaproteobacteria bacterium]|nr:cytoplasmic protein [Deltaproteobacteria bacterium]MBW2218832.1 cytoplasmic protein [Deltaproteobacteria bacterium]